MENKTIVPPLEWYNEKRKVKDLVPYEFNPRKLTEERKQLLINSIEKFNLAEVPAINLDNVIIAGHQRIKVLMEIGRGEEEIDVRVPNRLLTEKEFKEYNITSNVPVGFWDIDVLEEHFQDVDLEALGLLASDLEVPFELREEEDNETETNFEPIPPKETITKFGDHYLFISFDKNIAHELVCGDSTDSKSYYNLLQDEKVDLIVTDPPYNVNVEGGTSEKLTIANDNMKSDDFYKFLFDFYSRTFACAKPGAPIYVFHADTEGVNFRKALTDAGFKLSQCLIWLKNSIVMSRQDYHWKHEPCLYSEKPMDHEEEVTEHDPILYGWKTPGAHPWHGDRKQSTVLEFKRPYRSAEHPTMKPIEMIQYLIKNSSKQKEIVLDPFGGSGTTLIACEKSWRNARVIEFGENYVDVHVKRYIMYMNENALDFEILKNRQILSKEELDRYLE
jgi:DNA modification methylase